jgi:galactofuranose transport system substrate-binding protein
MAGFRSLCAIARTIRKCAALFDNCSYCITNAGVRRFWTNKRFAADIPKSIGLSRLERQREEFMHLMKWLGGAAVGLGLMVAGSSAFAVTIGFSQVGDEGDWRPAFSKDMQEEAKKEGIDLKFADAQGKEEEQLKAVRSFIAQKVDAIIIAPVVVTGWDQVLEEAKKAGIPVFLADRDVDVADKSLFVTRISADFNLEGKLAGAWLAQASKGNCNIVELQGTTGSAPAIERKKGFESVISLFPQMKIVKTQSGNFTTDGGKQVMEAFIKATDNLKGICGVFAHNDNMQLGAIQAMKEAGLKPGKDFLMVSVDYVPAMKEALAAGDSNASVELRSAIGKYIYPVVLGYLKDKSEQLPKWVVIPSDLHAAATPGS